MYASYCHYNRGMTRSGTWRFLCLEDSAQVPAFHVSTTTSSIFSKQGDQNKHSLN